MKKSFLKRAIASAVAVPLALTQCLMPVLAVEVPTDIAVAADTAVTTHLTADSFTNIDPDKIESNWNEVFNGILVVQKEFSNKEINPDVVRNFIISKAGKYKDFAGRICSKLNNTTVSYTFGSGFTLKGQIDDVSNIIGEEVQQKVDSAIADVVKQYGDDVDFSPIQNLDFSSLKASASFEIEIGTADIEDSKSAPVTYKIIAEDGNTYTLEGENSFVNYVCDKYQEVRDIVIAANDTVFSEVRTRLNDAQVQYNDAKAELDAAKVKLDEAESSGVNVEEARAEWTEKKAKLDDAKAQLDQAEIDYKNAGGDADKGLNNILSNYDDKMNTAIDEYVKGMNKLGRINASGDSLADVLQKYKKEYSEKYSAKYPNAYDRLEKQLNRIPTSATDAVNRNGVKELYNGLFESVSDMIPETVDVDINLDDLAAIFDSLYNVSLTTNDSTGEIIGYMEDDQLAEVEAYYETQGKKVISSVKKVEAKFPTSGEGSVYYNVTRILELEDIESTTTTTVTTTTTDTQTTTTTVTSDSDVSDTETTVTTVTSDSDTGTDTTVTTVTSGSDTGTDTTVTTVTSGSDTGTDTTVTTVTSGSDTGTDTTATSGSDTSTSTTVTTVTSGSDTSTDTSTETTPAEVSYKIEIEGDPFYYSHDDENFADKEGFSVVAVDEEGNETPLEADDYTLNYASPYATVSDILSKNFKYEIVATVKADNATASVEVYIAALGDVTLDNDVNASDASAILAYYGKISAGQAETANLYTKSEFGEEPIYEKFARFLAATNVDGVINSSDGSNILDYYAKLSSNKFKTNDDIKAFWKAKYGIES